MLSKAQKTRLGAFIVLGSLLLLAILVAIAGTRLVERKDTYYISFENYSVQGLQVGGTVNFRGIKVGRVEAIKIDPKDVNKVIITVSVDRGTPIKTDASATLIFVGITGVKAVEISPGTNTAALLKPKSFIKTGSTMLDSLSDRAVSITEKIDQIAANINQLTDEENRKNIAAILNQTSLLLADTRANMNTTMISLNQVASNTAKLTDGLNDTIERITNTFVENVNEITQTSNTSLMDISQTTQSSLEKLTDSASTNISSVSENANRMMNRMSDDVAQKLDILTRSATGSLDSITAVTTKGLESISLSTTTGLDSIGVATTRGVNNFALKLNSELDRLSFSLDASIKEINTNTNALLVDTRTQLNQIGNNSNEMILMTTRQIAQMSQQINSSIARVNQLLESSDFDGIIGNLNTLSGQLTEVNMKDLVAELVQTLNKASTAIGNIDRLILRNRANLNETMESLREATANLNEFSRQIADQPSAIIRGN